MHNFTLRHRDRGVPILPDMKIGFDAKRAFFNRSGLGNYSRSTIGLLCRYAPHNEYVLFSPRRGSSAGYTAPTGTRTLYPCGAAARVPSLWRSYAMSGSIKRGGVELYHGLSNELPRDIKRAAVRSVVTIHDLIFERFPELYKPADRWLYRSKYRDSCLRADRIIAISLQTKADLVDLWGMPPEKIDVVYQGCDPMFYDAVTTARMEEVKRRYNLPPRFILSVGTIEERKNLMLTLRALTILGPHSDVDLVACGRQTAYAAEIKEYARKHSLAERVHLLDGVDFADLPVIYRLSEVSVYASLFEGFGIPILESLASGIPVITTRGGVFPETGGGGCLYVDPHSVDEMTGALQSILAGGELKAGLVQKGLQHAALFGEERIATNLEEVYRKVLA